MICTTFEKSTGKILGSFNVPKGKENYQVSDSEGWIEGSYDADKFLIVNRIPVELPPQPSPHHVFDYTTKQWIDPRTPETEWLLVRAKRDRLIAATDWTQLPDVPLTTKEMWANYRQALRDVTLQSDPFNIVWPTAPQ